MYRNLNNMVLKSTLGTSFFSNTLIVSILKASMAVRIEQGKEREVTSGSIGYPLGLSFTREEIYICVL